MPLAPWGPIGSCGSIEVEKRPEMHVLAMEVVIRIPDAQSIKDRRRVVRSLVEAPRHRYSVASAEVDDASDHKRAVLGYAAVSGTPAIAESQMDSVEDLVWSHPGVEVVSLQRSWLER